MTRRHITAEVAAGHIWGPRAEAARAAIIACRNEDRDYGDWGDDPINTPEREPEDPDHIERRETAMRERQEARFS